MGLSNYFYLQLGYLQLYLLSPMNLQRVPQAAFVCLRLGAVLAGELCV